MLIVYIVIGIILILFIYILIIYNSFIKSNNKVKEAFSTMDVYLKKRWDLIPELVETVKGYAAHEKSTLEEVIKLRNNDYNNLSLKEKINTNSIIARDIRKIMIVAENYPELKASSNFLDLSKKLTNVENDIANSRKYYNGCVRQFNNKVEMFPNSILAKLFGFSSKNWFEAKEDERDNVKFNL